MISLLFLAGFILYCIVASLPYTKLPASYPTGYFSIGICVGIFTNILWLSVAKMIGDKNKVLVAGVWWDSMIMLAYLIIPIIIFSVRPTPLTGLGVALILIGLVLTKL